MGFALVHGEKAFVKVGFGGEFGVGAEEGVEEGHLRDVATDDDDADGEGGGEDEPGPSPEECPEDGHGEKGEGGDAGAGAVEPGFDEVGGGEFESEEECEDEDGRQPGAGDGDGDDEWECEASCGADVGDDAKYAGEDSPERGVGNADEIEAGAKEDSVRGVDCGLKEEVLADAGGGFLKSLRHETDAAHAGEEEDAVAQVFALHQEIDGEDDDDAYGSYRTEEAHEEVGGGLELASVGVDDANGLDLSGRLLIICSGCRCERTGDEVVADVFEGNDGLFEGLLGRRVDSGHLLLDFEAVVGKRAGDVEELARDDVAYSTDAEEGEDADERDGEDAGDSPGFEAGDGGGQ